MTNLSARILILPFLMLCAACSTTTQLVPVEKVKHLLPPKALVQLCPDLPKGSIVTNGDLVDDRDATRTAYKGCAAKMAGIVKWRAAHAKD